MNNVHLADHVTRQFQIEGELLHAEPYGSGHINDTYCASFREEGSTTRYVFQRINQKVFKNPVFVMENVQRVTTHLATKVAADPDKSRLVLNLIPARDGNAWHLDDTGEYWRAYRFIENAHTYDTAQSTEQAYQAAKAYGRFQMQLVDLPGPRLHDVIADFHNTAKRLSALEQAIEFDQGNRAALTRPEIEFAYAHRSLVDTLAGANLPERITHNDTKFNNVMLDDATGESICVLDLDTVMPGLTVFDFGDMVRTTTSPVEEDEKDLTKVVMQFPMFEALVRGYLASAGEFLTEAEKRHLVFAGKLITFEQGIRFLTDYLSNDVYYKVSRDAHNLDRCRTQFKLMDSIEQQEEEMHRLVNSL